MQTRLIRLRFRRRIRKGQRQVEDLGVQAEKSIEQHLFKRFDRLVKVKRFVIGWLGLMLILLGALVAQNLALSNYYQTFETVPGGIYTEGILGRFTNANPIYATSDADASVSRLVFAGLLNYGPKGQLVTDLAKDYSVEGHGNTYVVHLKPGLKWQDGRPLTSADVVFTYQLIQNPDVQSPLRGAWQDIKITAPDDHTVVFKLPGALAPFPYSLTTGILPKHLLDGIAPADMRSAEFNTIKPVGSGPFAWQAINVSGDGNPKHAQEQIGLIPFADYQGGKPKLQQFVIRVFADKDQMIKAFADNQLTAVEGLTDVPAGLKGNTRVVVHNLPLRAANMVFFRTSQGVLADQKIRQALVRGADTNAIISALPYPTRPTREPILIGQIGYDPALAQPGHDSQTAASLLDADGWKLDKTGYRTKDGKTLIVNLTVADTPEYRQVGQALRSQWSKIGVKTNLQFLDTTDFQTALTYHDYDAIIYGISIGADPDVFVYWDSSQADIRSANRLNLSEYKNPTADAALEAGRTRIDPTLRVIKYRPFLQAWQQDAPALGLYQPRVLYLTNGTLNGLGDQPINTSTDRYSNVQNWEIKEAKVTN